MNNDITQLRDAGARADAAYLWEDAAQRYEQCLTALGDSDPREQAALLTRIGHCYRNLAQARPAWRSLMRAISIYRDLGDAPRMAEATLEALHIWAPEERKRGIAQAALDALGPGESHAHADLLFWLDRIDEGRAIAEKHGYADILAGEERWRAFELIGEGRIDEYVALSEKAHEAYAAAGDHDRSINALRGSGYAVLAAGRLDEGEALAHRAWDAARTMRLRFHEELAGLDVAGVLFARSKLDACSALLDGIPGEQDFRKDLFRAWIAEQRGETERAITLLPSPERAGGAFGALSQMHSGRAGILWRSGKERAAEAEMHAWVDAARRDGRLIEDAAAMVEQLVAAADESLLREMLAPESDALPNDRYSTLQGRGLDRARGAIAMRLGRIDDAERHYRTGAAWAAAQRCPLDEAQCLRGLAEVTAARGGRTTSY